MTERGSLSNQVIWHTRPLDVAGGLAQRGAALGATVLTAPVLRICPFPENHPAQRAALQIATHLDDYSQVIFVSANAVQQGLALIDRCWTAWPPGTVCYAIGKATEQRLAERGLTARRASGPSMNSEALLELPELHALAGERVLIVRGKGGRGLLARTLVERGARVDYLEAYQRKKSDTLPAEIEQAVESGLIDFITASSGETVENIINLVDHSLQAQLLRCVIVVPGERVAAIAESHGFKTIVQARNAGDEAVVEAIVNATNKKGGKIA